MNDQIEIKKEIADKSTGLVLLRKPFKPNQISKLPKPTKKQTFDLNSAMDRKDFSLGIRCTLCGQWHHRDVVHLDYVGHAALTDRLLDCDPAWNWEPLAFRENGTPALDENGGMWIRLTVCGVTRFGYGHPDGKKGGDAIKEVIGDALRNAAMRFGAALDLWHKGDLHRDDDDAPPAAPPQAQRPAPRPPAPRPDPSHDKPSPADHAISALGAADTLDALVSIWRDLPAGVKSLPEVAGAKDNRKAELNRPPADAVTEDQIPY